MSRVDTDAPSILVWTEESGGGGAEATVSSALPRTWKGDMHDRGQDSSPTFYCKALYDYSSTDPSSLSFRAGDIIEVLTTLTSGWWDGLLDGETRGWFPSTFTTTISRDDAERALHSRNVRPSVSDSEALVSLGPFSPGDSASDWLADEMSYGLGRESFNDLANSSFDQPAKGHQQQNDFWMPEVGDDGQ
ncbi:SH3-domain-containing protein, partial [Exidia glandulosa HHB12029]